MIKRRWAWIIAGALPAVVLSDGLLAEPGGRLLATGGATMIEGSAGGGIVPWAVMSGYGTREEWGGDVFATRVDTGDYRLVMPIASSCLLLSSAWISAP